MAEFERSVAVNRASGSLAASVAMFPTPTATPYGTRNNGCPGDGREEYATKGAPSLDTMARRGMWPTPCVPNGGRVNRPEDVENAGSRPDGRKVQVDLASAVRCWPTPRSSPNENRQTKLTPSQVAGTHGRSLAAEVFAAFPTPRATDATHGGRVTPRKSREGGNLIEAVSARTFATPTARDWRSGKASEETMERNARPLSEVGGHLSPEWVELLMGWPRGWASLEPLPTGVDRWRDDFLYGRAQDDWLDGTWENGVPRVATGVKDRIARLKAIGNGQVSVVAAMAWVELTRRFT